VGKHQRPEGPTVEVYSVKNRRLSIALAALALLTASHAFAQPPSTNSVWYGRRGYQFDLSFSAKSCVDVRFYLYTGDDENDWTVYDMETAGYTGVLCIATSDIPESISSMGHSITGTVSATNLCTFTWDQTQITNKIDKGYTALKFVKGSAQYTYARGWFRIEAAPEH
jgi:hypothetical protein